MPLNARLHQDEDGVSLVELMVAILVMGIILAALAQSLVGSLRNVESQETNLKATALANQLLEDLQGMDWEETALCNGEATTYFGSSSFEGRPLALLSDTHPLCASSDPDRVQPEVAGVTRDGISYTVTTAVTWVDDPQDGTGASDADGPQDLKRFVVDLTWDVRGDARTLRAEARRAPSPDEQLVLVEIAPNVINIRDEGEGEDAAQVGWNRDKFVLSATSKVKQSAVSVKWTDRNGGTETRTLVTSDGGFTWSVTVPQNVGPFRNGETSFFYTATEPDGDVTNVVDRGLFLHDLENRSLTMTPSTLYVRNSDGAVCPFTVDVDVQGALLSDTVLISWGTGPVTSAMVAVDDSIWGSSFTQSYGGETDWASVPLISGGPGATTMTIDIERVADLATLQISQTVTAQGVDACPS